MEQEALTNAPKQELTPTLSSAITVDTLKPKEDIFDKRFTELVNRVDKTSDETKKLQEDTKEQKSYLLLGFFILALMFGTLLVMVLIDWKNSNDRLLDKVDSLQSITPSKIK
jgi:hypothetical protein